MNHKSCIEDIIIGNVLWLFQFRELRRACDYTGAKVRVSQRLKSLRGIVVRNCGFSETDFFVVCDDIWIAICPSFVVVMHKLHFHKGCSRMKERVEFRDVYVMIKMHLSMFWLFWLLGRFSIFCKCPHLVRFPCFNNDLVRFG